MLFKGFKWIIIWTVFSLLAGVIILLVLLPTCRNPEHDKVIPKSMGAHEGLWMYKGNTRSRTDGTESTPILDELEIDGVTYSAKDYEIYSIEYFRAYREIYFTLKLADDSFYLYYYNYHTKENSALGELPSGNLTVYASDNLVYAKNSKTVVVFDREGNKVDDNYSGKFEGDLVSDALSAQEESPLYGYKDSVKFKVNGYTFFIDEKAYGTNGCGGAAGYCYYLNRERGGNKQVLQYAFNDKEKLTFNDIYGY
ncbi:MAG: hypothetical protein K2G38_06985 [Clostridia bacterium]|nr:hypothetical protein [Clostridia bacterium]